MPWSHAQVGDKVVVDGLTWDRTEVTIAQFDRYVRADRCANPRRAGGRWL